MSASRDGEAHQADVHTAMDANHTSHADPESQLSGLRAEVDSLQKVGGMPISSFSSLLLSSPNVDDRITYFDTQVIRKVSLCCDTSSAALSHNVYPSR